MRKKPVELSFEEGLAKLEEIAKMMEITDVPLADLLMQYEEGIKLSQYLSDKLTSAQATMKAITDNGVEPLPSFEEEDA